jgi:hypothetical protein
MNENQHDQIDLINQNYLILSSVHRKSFDQASDLYVQKPFQRTA